MNSTEVKYTISSFRVSGFDLLVTLEDGKQVTLKNGLSDTILGQVILENLDGTPISKKEIISKIDIHKDGLDSIFLENLISADQQTEEKSNDSMLIETLQKEVASASTENTLLRQIQQDLLEKLQKASQSVESLQKEIDQHLENQETAAAESAEERKEVSELAESFQPNMLEAVGSPPAGNDDSDPLPIVRTVLSAISAEPTNINKNENRNVLVSTVRLISDVTEAEASTGIPNEEAVVTGLDANFITNVSAPIFMGETTPHASVDFTIDEKLYSVKADGKGIWLVTASPIEKEGSYAFTLEVTNHQGSKFTDQRNLIIDRTPPATGAALTQETDTGLSAYDNITMNQQPKLSGITKPESTVEIILAGETYKVEADTKGAWEYQFLTDMSHGKHDYTLKVTDKAGNQASSEHSFTVNTLPPKLTGGLLTEDMNDPTAVTDGRAETTEIFRPVLKGETELTDTTVSIKYGENLLESGVATVDASGNWTFAIPEVHLGENKYVVTAENIAGVQTVLEKSFTYTPRAKVGELSLSARLAAKDDSGAADNLTNKYNNLTIEGESAKDALVTLNFAGRNYTTTVGEDGTWSIQTNGRLEEGMHNYIVTAKQGALSATYKSLLVVDKTAPATTIIFDGLNRKYGNDYYHVGGQGSYGMHGVTEPGASVRVEGREPASTVADSAGNWRLAYTWNRLSNGSYPYTVKVADLAGNESTVSGKFVVNNLSPTLGSFGLLGKPLLNSGAGAQTIYTNDSSPVLIGSTGNNAESLTLNVWGAGRGRYKIPVEADGSFTFALPAALYSAAGYSRSDIQLEVIGKNGMVRRTYVNSIGISDTKPVLTGDLLADSDTGVKGDKITSNSRPTLEGNIVLPGTGVVFDHRRTSAKISIDGNPPVDVTLDNTGKWTHVDSGAQFTYGIHNYTLYVVDQFGNQNMYTSSFTITDPQGSYGRQHSHSILIGSYSAGGSVAGEEAYSSDIFSNNPAQTLNGRFSPNEKVVLIVDGKSYNVQANDTGDWELTLHGLTDGVYNYEVRSPNERGELDTTFTGRFTIDSTPPTLTDVSRTMGADSVPTFTGRTEIDSTVEVIVTGKNKTTGKVDSESKAIKVTTEDWSIPWSNALANGKHEYSIKVTDKAGNKGDPIVGEIIIGTGLDINEEYLSQSEKPTLTFSGVATASATVQVILTKKDDATIKEEKEVTAGADGNWKVNWETGLADGDYTYSVKHNSTTITGALDIGRPGIADAGVLPKPPDGATGGADAAPSSSHDAVVPPEVVTMGIIHPSEEHMLHAI